MCDSSKYYWFSAFRVRGWSKHKILFKIWLKHFCKMKFEIISNKNTAKILSFMQYFAKWWQNVIYPNTTRILGAPLIEFIENKLNGFYYRIKWTFLQCMCVSKRYMFRCLPRSFITRLNDKLHKNLNLQIPHRCNNLDNYMANRLSFVIISCFKHLRCVWALWKCLLMNLLQFSNLFVHLSNRTERQTIVTVEQGGRNGFDNRQESR